MVICEMCGKEVGRGVRIRVDKAILVVGPECTRFGSPVESAPPRAPGRLSPTTRSSASFRRVERAQPARQTGRGTDPLEGRGEELVPDYSRRIMKARNELGFKQEELAAKLNEKRSVIRELEAGTLIPNDALIRKLERQLKIKLMEKISQEYKIPSAKRREMTLGDLVKK